MQHGSKTLSSLDGSARSHRGGGSCRGAYRAVDLMLIRRQMEAERRKPNATYFRIFLNRRPDNKGFGMELARAFLADF